ncbi:MAG TPA: site-2 protease family protein [Candidatus Angelobacter sp.]|nr:site-2 protease family protein [Candidatus Angelobacter sp.]
MANEESSSTPGVSTGGAPPRGASIRGSWKIGEFAGIGVYIHATFLILVAWVLFVYWHAGHTVKGMLTGLLFTLALFACVVLHEFGHAFAARHYGIGTRDITLLPIGGVSRLERIPDQPKQEFYVAVMGPVVSIAIAVVLYAAFRISGGVMPPVEALSSWTATSFVARLIYANAILAVFNLLPAFPMDGGRIFRALLARFMPSQKATRIAAGVGHAMAVLFAVLGLFMNPFLILIALFIWMGASQEATMAQMKSTLEGVSARHMMITNFASLSPDDPLERAVELILHGSQQDFPIVKNGRLVGMLSNKDLLHGLSQRGAESPISQAMRQDCPVLAATDDLQTVMEKLQSSNCHVMPVVDRGELVGLFTSENLAEFVMVQSALNNRRAPRPDAQAGDERRSA